MTLDGELAVQLLSLLVPVFHTDLLSLARPDDVDDAEVVSLIDRYVRSVFVSG